MKTINNKIFKTTLFGTSLALAAQFAQADVILHAFNWSYDEVASKAQEIADIGYKKVLVAPAVKSNKHNTAWWGRYQPQDFRVIEHNLGNKESFQNMINALNAVGVATYADVVINQMANERGNSTYFPGDYAVGDYANYRDYWERQKLFGNLDYGLFGPGDFHDGFCISDWTNWGQSMTGRICGEAPDPGMPDLKPNDHVKGSQRAYLQALKNMGVKGFRVDAAKHMTYDHINAVFTSDIISGMHVFGEIITGGGSGNADYDTFLEPYLRNTAHSAYDFPLLKTMRDAFSSSGSLNALANPKSWGGAIDGPRAVTVTVTHDIPLNGGFRYQIMSETNEHLAYAYIMGRQDGVPMVFSDKTGTDNGRWYDDYKQSNLKSMVKFHNAVKGEGEEILHSDNCTIVYRRGKEGLVGINKCNSEKWIGIPTSSKFYWSKDYVDVFTGARFNIDESTHWISIPGRTARMWLPEGGSVGNNDNVNVNFTCNNGYTNWGDSVYVVGNIGELGNWNTSNATKLDPTNYPTWKKTLSLPANANVEWKCIIRDEQNGNDVTKWEPGANNKVNTGSGGASTTGSF
tara:strand:- start:7282 stop:9000 length:1719 start_codon:yes stop_codon:yes gene_type:complete